MKKKRPTRVADLLMSKGAGASTIKPSETIGNLARRLQQERVGAMIVSEDGKSIDGIISERDVAYALALHRGELHALSVASLMTRNAVTCSPEDTIAEAARVMAERHIRHLPVTDGDRLVGMIGMRDIFLARLEEMRHVTRILGSYLSAPD
jgi:CBS domain-containing protein